MLRSPFQELSVAAQDVYDRFRILPYIYQDPVEKNYNIVITDLDLFCSDEFHSYIEEFSAKFSELGVDIIYLPEDVDAPLSMPNVIPQASEVETIETCTSLLFNSTDIDVGILLDLEFDQSWMTVSHNHSDSMCYNTAIASDRFLAQDDYSEAA